MSKKTQYFTVKIKGTFSVEEETQEMAEKFLLWQFERGNEKFTADVKLDK
jgi:hypothetical protein